MKRLVLFFIKFYQIAISPALTSIFGNACRYQPTCSQYMYEAVSAKGVMYGLYLGVRRVLRCHPWSEGGWDPLT